MAEARVGSRGGGRGLARAQPVKDEIERGARAPLQALALRGRPAARGHILSCLGLRPRAS